MCGVEVNARECRFLVTITGELGTDEPASGGVGLHRGTCAGVTFVLVEGESLCL